MAQVGMEFGPVESDNVTRFVDFKMMTDGYGDIGAMSRKLVDTLKLFKAQCRIKRSIFYINSSTLPLKSQSLDIQRNVIYNN